MGSISEIIPQAKPDDLELVSRIQNGERDQFRLLAERYAERLMRMVRRLVPSKEDAEEVTQDALLDKMPFWKHSKASPDSTRSNPASKPG